MIHRMTLRAKRELDARILRCIKSGANTAPLIADDIFGALAWTHHYNERASHTAIIRHALTRLESKGRVRRIGLTGKRPHHTVIWEACE